MKNGRVVCAEALHNAVKIFTREGNFLRKIQSQVNYK
jgi:hypothetical protein